MAQITCSNCGYPYAIKCSHCPNCGAQFECNDFSLIGCLFWIFVIGAIASDRRLKRDISLVGTSPSGCNIYTFKYLDSDQLYQGVMAQELLEKYPFAVFVKNNGYLSVNYDLIDVDFLKITN
jgi:hypothetical protein